jgi:hypothetical protein
MHTVHMPTDRDAVSTALLHELNSRGISLREAARQLHRNPEWLRRRVVGRVAWRLDEIDEVAGAFDIPTSTLIRAIAA